VSGTGANTNNFYHGSTTMYLLPYIEQQRLYDCYNMAEPAFTYDTVPAFNNRSGSFPEHDETGQ